MPCMCGATDCPSCGPAQGYRVVRVYNYKTREWEHVNSEEEDCDEEPADQNNTAEDAAEE